MPIYEYVCTHCGEPLEKLQKLSDAPLTDCPACGQASLKRKMSAAGFRLSGGGWYETDFKSDNRRNLSSDSQTSSEGNGSKSASGESGASSGASGGESKKSDSASGKSGSESKSSSTSSSASGS
ncbi:zinc ribbon domain-containing protein [Salinisphaera sp. SPP-AMP-43]|uniref:FmdB family zinc ribbon protein n=1 Tax=Salinisphaera sp. SPP-AMP-43 TaxID=3121288 RepID=UPI003C6E6ABE